MQHNSVCVPLQSLLFNTSKPFSRSQNCGSQDVELMVDCFVSCFRITPHNNDLLKVCLNAASPTMFHFVLVNVLHRIITQVLSNVTKRELAFIHCRDYTNFVISEVC